jgi:HD-like signal output (HDOD) protein
MKTTDRTKPILMERVIASIGELPTSPAIVSSVMGLTSNLNTSIDKLSHALSSDLALTAKVLRLSNSPFYGRARTVQSLQEAIMILGFSTIRSLVVASSTYSMFKHGHDKGLEDNLWHHSLVTAMGARIIAKRIGKTQFIEEFFLAGLLHDIGVLVLLKRMPLEYAKVLEEERTAGTDRDEAERSILGFTHAELGSLVLERWNFPSILSNAVRCHSNPDSTCARSESGEGGKSEMMIAHAVNFADEVAHALGYGFMPLHDPDLLRLPSAKFLGLSAEGIIEITQELSDRVSDEQKLFEG